ncbi:MAG: ABC transporter substrate-binding protein [Sulfurospirillum sp.]|nr:ABC transporter substrate-binding protein [Sulfurospirillum sp.]
MILKKLVLFFCILLFLHVDAFALKEEQIKETMQTKIDSAAMILQKKDLTLATKASMIFEELDATFDFALMARLSLGKHFATLNTEQQEKFVKAFEGYMKKSYIDKLELYTNEKIVVTQNKKVQENRIWLFTQLIGEKENFDIIYKFYKNPQNDWLIYDVDVIGVSIIKTYRAQFEDILNANTFAVLLEKIQNAQ